MTNLEGRVLLRRRVNGRRRGVWTDLQVLKALADRARCAALISQPTRARRLRRAPRAPARAASPTTPASPMSGSTPRTACSGRARTSGHPGTPRLFLERFATDGRPRPLPSRSSTGRPPRCRTSSTRYYPDHRPRAGPIPVRDADPPRAGARRGRAGAVRRDPSRHRAQPRASRDGDMVRLTHAARARGDARRGSRRDIRLDTLFVPFHWGGGGCANSLTNPALDPISKMPEFKVCAVRIEKVGAKRRRRGPRCQRHTTDSEYEPWKQHRDFCKACFPSRAAASTSRRRSTARSPTRSRPTSARSSSTSAPATRAPELIYLVLMRDGKPMRYFPIGAKASDPRAARRRRGHLIPDTKLELLLARAARAWPAIVVIDIGLVEI